MQTVRVQASWDSSLPLEVAAPVLVVTEAGGLGLALRHHLHASRVGAEARHVIGDGLRAALGERDVVLLGARRIGVPDEVDALALGLLDALRVLVEAVALARLDRRVVEAEVDGGERARRVDRIGRAGLAA